MNLLADYDHGDEENNSSDSPSASFSKDLSSISSFHWDINPQQEQGKNMVFVTSPSTRKYLPEISAIEESDATSLEENHVRQAVDDISDIPSFVSGEKSRRKMIFAKRHMRPPMLLSYMHWSCLSRTSWKGSKVSDLGCQNQPSNLIEDASPGLQIERLPTPTGLRHGTGTTHNAKRIIGQSTISRIRLWCTC